MFFKIIFEIKNINIFWSVLRTTCYDVRNIITEAQKKTGLEETDKCWAQDKWQSCGLWETRNMSGWMDMDQCHLGQMAIFGLGRC